MSTVTDLESRIAILEQQLADLNSLLGRMAPAAEPLADTDELLSEQPVLEDSIEIGDLFYVVDVSDVTDGAWGSSKQTDGNRIAEFVGLQGYIKDADADGQQYARQDNAWTVVEGGSIPGNANTVVIADGAGGAAGQDGFTYDGTVGIDTAGDVTALSILGHSTTLDTTPLLSVSKDTGNAPITAYADGSTHFHSVDGTRARITSDGNFSNNQGWANSEAFGETAAVLNTQATAIGDLSSASVQSVAVGYGANAITSSVAVGRAAVANGQRSFALGWGATDGNFSGAIALGARATATAGNQMVIGAYDPAINNLFIGQGVTTTNADPHITVHASGTTHATGNAGDLRLVGGTLDGTGQSGSEGNLVLGHDGTNLVGTVSISGNTYPTVTGTNGQFLQTDGAGQLSWQTVSGGGTIPGNANTVVIADGAGGAAGEEKFYWDTGGAVINGTVYCSDVNNIFSVSHPAGKYGKLWCGSSATVLDWDDTGYLILSTSPPGSDLAQTAAYIVGQISSSPTSPAMFLRGRTNQSADIMQWNSEGQTNWADGTRARVDSDGYFSGLARFASLSDQNVVDILGHSTTLDTTPLLTVGKDTATKSVQVMGSGDLRCFSSGIGETSGIYFNDGVDDGWMDYDHTLRKMTIGAGNGARIVASSGGVSLATAELPAAPIDVCVRNQYYGISWSNNQFIALAQIATSSANVNLHSIGSSYVSIDTNNASTVRKFVVEHDGENGSGTPLLTVHETDGITAGATVNFGAATVNSASTTTASVALNGDNHQVVDLSPATGDVTLTLTAPSGVASGVLVIKQGAAVRNIIWATSDATLGKWLGTEFDWSTMTANKAIAVSWCYDGTDIYLSAAGEETTSF